MVCFVSTGVDFCKSKTLRLFERSKFDSKRASLRLPFTFVQYCCSLLSFVPRTGYGLKASGKLLLLSNVQKSSRKVILARN